MLTPTYPTPAIALPEARVTHRWLAAMAIVLCGYALTGRGFAYIGIHPLYIGEFMLLSGLTSLLLIRQWRAMLTPVPVMLLVALAAWGAWRTMPYLGRYGIDAVRDLMIIAYGSFAVIIFGYVIDQPVRLRLLVDWFARFGVIYLAAIPLIWIVMQFASWVVPNWPWAPVQIIDAKGGDILVHLAGITAFGVAGMRRPLSRWQLISLAMCVAMIGAYSRGGLVSFLAAYSLCIVLRPKAQSVRGVAAVWICVAILLAISMVRIDIPGKEREISFAQLVENVTSVAGKSEAGDLDGTKKWRLNWWGDILDYTVFGSRRWTGKGFGVNLAVDDGYGVEAEQALRSPHNGHMTMLARSGVPGLGLWLAIHATWAIAMLRRYLRSAQLRQHAWAGMFMWLVAYWSASMINGTFDVYFEGPMGGIWLWSIIGVGLAAMWIYDRDPSILNERS